MAERHPEWNKRGIFHTALQRLDEESSLQLVKLMDEVGADLTLRSPPSLSGFDLSSYRRFKHHWNRALIDIAALRGFLSVLEYISTHGAQMSECLLLDAIEDNNATLVRSLLSVGSSASWSQDSKEHSIIAAISIGSVDILRLLFKHSENEEQLVAADSNTDFQSTTPTDLCCFLKRKIESGYLLSPNVLGAALAYAICEGEDSVVECLIDAGADLDVILPRDSTSRGPSALSFAINRQEIGLVRRLLEAGSDPDKGDSGDYYHTPPLVQAVMQGDHAIVELLIFAGAKTRVLSDPSSSPLIESLKRRDRRLVQLLLDSGADPNEILDMSDRTKGKGVFHSALEVAVENGDIEIIQLLLSRGADPHDQEALCRASSKDEALLWLMVKSHREKYPGGRIGFGSQAMKKALNKGRVLLVETMLHMGFDFSSFIRKAGKYCQDMSPFGLAIERPDCSADLLAKFLQQSKGCTAESVVCSGYSGRGTALIEAINSGDISKVRLFIEYGADVNRPASFGIKRTPLQEACEQGNEDIFQLLLRYGADVNGAPALRGGATALQLAAIQGHFSIAAELLSRKAEVDAPAPKPDGRTALEGAAEHGRLDMVKFLLEAGAGARGKDTKQIERAAAYAEENDFRPIADMLRDWCRFQHEQPYIETFTDLVDWDLE